MEILVEMRFTISVFDPSIIKKIIYSPISKYRMSKFKKYFTQQ